MAGDLIPPPSPAGRPDRDAARTRSAFRDPWREPPGDEHTGLLEPTVAEAPAPSSPPAPSRYRGRFGLITGALAGLAIAAVVIAVLVVSGSTPTSSELPWSAWKPQDKDPNIAAAEIGYYVSKQYRLNSGDQLVEVDGGPLQLGGLPLNIVVRTAGKGEGGNIEPVGGESMLYVLRGLGPRGSIDSEEPSEKRLRLVQREALEIALYTFRYIDDVDNVVVLLPPAPPSPKERAALDKLSPNARAANAGDATDGQPLPAMLFRPGDFEPQLRQPLAASLPPDPPRPSTMTDEEAAIFERIARSNAFDASVVPDQTGTGFLVLDRIATNAAGDEALRSTLKA